MAIRLAVDLKALRKKVSDCTDKIKVGETYFLSSFYDKEGAMVKVLKKSKKKNRLGFNSTITVEVIEPLDPTYQYYKVGAVHTCNATNLYEKRELAGVAAQFNRLK